MSPTRRLATTLVAALSLVFAAPALAVTANGRLQIIQLDVGQGDGAVLISPLGQVVLIDDGDNSVPIPAMGRTVVQQLQDLGINHVTYHFASHYHQDHIGNLPAIKNAGISIDYGWDRGSSYGTQTYTNYVNALGASRRTIVKNQVITLDSLSAHPVTIKCIDLAGAGISTTDENSLSIELRVSYGEFDESFGGDLPGYNSSTYKDVEDAVAPETTPVEVYKVHHHGSATSSNPNWLSHLAAKIAVISEGNGNSYGHPTSSALGRLHSAGVHTYWTETGNGVAPLAGLDKVSNGQVIISATWEPGGVDTIRGNGFADTFTNSGTAVDHVAPVVTVTSPNGGEDWKAGSIHDLSWTATDNIGVTTIDLDYSTDGGLTYPNSIDAGVGNNGYIWQVPETVTGSARVRITAHDAAGNVGADASNGNFAISTWTIAASAAAGGGIDPSGSVAVPEDESQSFTITPGTGWQIANLIVDGSSAGAMPSYTFNNVAGNHTIAATFRDVQAPVVQVTSPNGGESFMPGSHANVTWNASDNAAVDSVYVDYALASGGPWHPIAQGIGNSGNAVWTVPNQPTDSARVRVTAFDHALNAGADASDQAFSITTAPAAVGDGGPAVLELAGATPNPASGGTLLRFSLPQAGSARIELVDVTGRRVWNHDAVLGAGAHALRWNGADVRGGRAGAGLYFVRLVTPWGTRTQRFVMLQ